MSAEYELGRSWRAANKGAGDWRGHASRVLEAVGVPENPARASYGEIEAAEKLASRRLKSGKYFCIGDLARGMLGERWRETMTQPRHVLEAEEANDASAFQHISGQLLITYTQKAYNAPQFIGDMVTRTVDVPSPWNLGLEKVPKLSSIIQGPQIVEPAMPYPHAQIAEDWVSYPAVGKHGEVINFTIEAVGSDRTGQMGETAAKLGYRLRYDLEVEQLSVVCGLTNNFSWKDTMYSTYLSSGANWINKITGQTVAGADYTIINNVETLMGSMLDPYSGLVIEVETTEMQLICPFQSRYPFRNIFGAEKIRSGDFATSGQNLQLEAASPLDKDYNVLPSKILTQLLLSAGISASNLPNYFWLGDFKRAFIYRQVLPWQVIAAPPLNPMEYGQDIVLSLKARRWGQTGVEDPRFAFQSTN